MRLALTLATGVLLVGLGLNAASAAPAMPQPGLLAGGNVEHVRMNNRRGSMMRHKRRMNTHRHGHPNAKNPAMMGHQQNMGGTAGGPRH